MRWAFTRLSAPDVEARVWAEVTALLSDPARLRMLAHAYLGLVGGDERQHESTLADLAARLSSSSRGCRLASALTFARA
jgi:hypothetical protein